MENSLELVKEVIQSLKEKGIDVLLGGGWAEELLGLSQPRKHGDIDLYFIGDNLQQVEKYLSDHQLGNSKQKGHKITYTYKNVKVEVTIIQKDGKGYFTVYFPSRRELRWPEPINQAEPGGIDCLSLDSLIYRRKTDEILKKRL